MTTSPPRMCEHGIVLGHPCVYCAAQEPDREKNRSFGPTRAERGEL